MDAENEDSSGARAHLLGGGGSGARRSKSTENYWERAEGKAAWAFENCGYRCRTFGAGQFSGISLKYRLWKTPLAPPSFLSRGGCVLETVLRVLWEAFYTPPLSPPANQAPKITVSRSRIPDLVAGNSRCFPAFSVTWVATCATPPR